MVDVSALVEITTRVSAGGIPSGDFGRGLLLTVDDAISAGGAGKVRFFESIDDVIDVFGSASQVAANATVWFSADPRPRGLYIGRWATADVSTVLRGVPTVAAGADPLNAANAAFSVNGFDVSVDLSSASTYAAIASAVEAAVLALAGSFTGATFTYGTVNGFELGMPDATAISGGALFAPGTGTDISAALGMGAASAGRTYLQGSDTETAVEAASAIVDLASGSEPAAVMLASDAPLTAATVDTRGSVAAWAQSSGIIFALLDTSAQVLVAGDATSLGALTIGAQQGRVIATYAESGQRPDIAEIAALSAQDLSQPATVITLHAKPLPGVQPSEITRGQLAELARKRVNVYTNVAGVPSLVGGYASQPGYWADSVWWLKWLVGELQTGVWSAMRRNRRLSRALLENALGTVLQQGAANGGIQPGRTVSAGVKADIILTTANRNFDGVLTSGYLYWVNPTITNRRAEGRIWLAGAEAIHTLALIVDFEQ